MPATTYIWDICVCVYVVVHNIPRGVKPPICIYDTQQMVENNARAGTVVSGVGKIGR